MRQLLAIKGLLERTTPEFREALWDTASRLGLNPSYLAAVIGFETAYTYSPAVQNPYTKATGLIQFMPATAKGLGTSIEDLKQLDPIAQLGFVERYFAPYAAKILRYDRPVDYYLAVFYPAFLGRSYNDAVFTEPSVGYTQNAGLDSDHDGKITVGDLGATIDKVVNEARGRPPIPLAGTGETWEEETPCS